MTNIKLPVDFSIVNSLLRVRKDLEMTIGQANTASNATEAERLRATMVELNKCIGYASQHTGDQE